MIIRAVDLNVDLVDIAAASEGAAVGIESGAFESCLLYTSDAADE